MKMKFLLICATFVALAGCTSVPLHNVSDANVITASGKPVTADQVRAAIVKAGSGLGWAMTPNDPGLVTGRLALRGHVAVVDVRYTAKNFSIVYKDSTNLDYTGTRIHRNYNGWVENLDRDIRANILSL